MLTICILIAGLAVVIGGILAFRLHAFAALILAGVLVAVLTPTRLVVRSAQLESTVKTVTFDRADNLVLAAEALKSLDGYVVCDDAKDGQSLQEVGRLVQQVRVASWNFDEASEVSSEAACYQFELTSEPVGQLALISVADMKSAVSNGKTSFIKRLTTALGSYCGNLAILIVAASIIGRCLLDSGAADRIVRSAVAAVGEKNAPIAFAASGFTLSIPVFFDTVFYLMIPLGKALRRRTGKNYLLYVLSIVAGGTMAHSLVPPTPGPLFIAEAFGVSIAAMIVGGCLIGVISSSVGMMYAYWINSRCVLELPEDVTTDTPDDAMATTTESPNATTDDSGPSLGLSLIPILLPVLLITAGALVSSEVLESGETEFRIGGVSIPGMLADAMTTLSEKNLALLISSIIAVLIFIKVKRPSREVLGTAMQDAVTSAGTIILVTAAGGAFGRMMRQTNVAELLLELQGTSPVMICVAAFVVTMVVRTAQGSSTVAMMTAAGIFGGLVVGGGAGVDPLYVALAVGCGSKPGAWMNDSGFLVITRMSGMTEQEGLKYITPMTSLAALAGLGAVIVGVILFP